MAALRVVLIINPVAGLGGTVALKGSDGQAVQQEALAKGARPQALERASVFLRTLLQEAGSQSLTWWARPDDAALLKKLGFVAVTPFAQAVELDADATRNTIAEMPSGVECVVFVGGDGTARDVLSLVPANMLCLGVPAGVKMHSGVFAVSPRAAGKLLAALARGKFVTPVQREVRDYDESQSEIYTYGEMRVPESGGWLQHTKSGGRESEPLAVEEIVADLAEKLGTYRPLILGPGDTLRALKKRLGIEGTRRGFDVLTATGPELDVAADRIEELVDTAKMVVSFSRKQGFLFGRGNQQVTSKALNTIAPEQIVIAGTRSKLHTLKGRPLLVDTGSATVDQRLAGLVEIVAGYEDRLLYRIQSAND